MLAIILTSPPHSLQVSTSISKTRFNLCAQVMDARRSAEVWFCLFSAFIDFLLLPRLAGVTNARYLLLGANSSGDIRFTRVGRDVVVERDSSGDIEVDSVAGDFTVLKDGSGDIDSRRVEGKVSIPDHKS